MWEMQVFFERIDNFDSLRLETYFASSLMKKKSQKNYIPGFILWSAFVQIVLS